MRWACAAATFLTASLCYVVQAQSPPPRDPVRRDRGTTPSGPGPAGTPAAVPGATTIITGRVVADDTGDPVRNARVSIPTTTERVTVVLADSEGRFAIAAESGSHLLRASKPGYARREITITGRGDPVEIRLPKAAVISGRALNEFGEPIIGARIDVEIPPDPKKPSSTQGARPPRPGGAGPSLGRVAFTQTDDGGEYRLGGLAAGWYVVAVTTFQSTPGLQNEGGMVVYRPAPQRLYYPGTLAAAEAQTVHVESGEEHASLDFVVSGDQSGGVPLGMSLGAAGVSRDLQQALASGTVTIRGRVTSTDGRPLSHAVTRLLPRGMPVPVRSGRTDEYGQFEFTGVVSGSFLVTAVKSGYEFVPPRESQGSSPGSAGTSNPSFFLFGPGVSIDVKDGETRERVDLTLARMGTLSGQVVDELGDPVEGAVVELLRVRYEAGRRRLVAAVAAARPTDDTGRFRLYNIPRGQYVVSANLGSVAPGVASGSATDVPGYARSYYPGTVEPAQAQFVSAGPSQDVVDIDFSMGRVPTAKITGRLLNSAGEPSTQGSLQLQPSQRSTLAYVSVGARIMKDGEFEFPNVAPGQYVIRADRNRKGPSSEGEFGAFPVSVAGTDVADLVLQTSAGSTIEGRLTFDVSDPSQIPGSSKFELSPQRVDYDLSPANLAHADIHQDWTFAMSGISGPRRLALTQAPEGWTLRAVLVNGIDVTDQPLPFGARNQSLTDVEVALTQRVNGVTGQVLDDRAQPLPGVTVVAFSADRDQWYPASRFMRRVVAASDGTFKISGLPQGTYYAAVIIQAPQYGPDAWQDSAFLESLIPRATTLTLGDGQQQVVNFKVAAQ